MNLSEHKNVFLAGAKRNSSTHRLVTGGGAAQVAVQKTKLSITSSIFELEA